MTACSSMRLFVVSRSAPDFSMTLPLRHVPQDERPAAGAGVAAAGAVGEEQDFGLGF